MNSTKPTRFEEMVAWYERKTDFLLDKYSGRHHRVHYHTGLFPPSATPARDRDALRAQIWDSQEAMLVRAADAWDAARTLAGEVLDVGCGLGGGPLFWAATTGARVTGVTPVAAHAPIIERLARDAGLSDRVRVLVADAHAVPGERAWDAAVATGASNYFDRARWFAHLARLLRPFGHVFIEDTFWVREELRAPFNDYWLSNVGCEREYLDAARAAGFRLVGREDVTRDAAGFWRLSIAWSESLLASGRANPDERRRSIAWQSRVYEGYLDGGFLNLLLHFVLAR
jgi:tocopherol O-methyltransferase